ncbi:uncharacterized protein METZ01_LOCUS223330, partial [marine metagenome]
TITNAKMAVDPANASNLSSGDVPLAQLGNVPDPDLTAQKADIALLAFKTQANGNLARYNLVDQSVDAFEDASGVNSGASTNATRTSENYYQGFVAGTDPTGGTITTYTGYKVHSFLSTGNTNFVVSSAGNVDVLVVGGGGGGGAYGGGGGAGGFRTSATHGVTAQTYVVAVGAGGLGVNDQVGLVGSPSTFDTITSAGGGRGGTAALDGGDGGSGGGGGYGSSGGDSSPTTSPVQGYSGGDGSGDVAQYPSGGGGGAGGAGQDSQQNNPGIAGNGGIGAQNLYRTGSNVYYASGGGGGVPDGGGYGSNNVAGTASAGGGGDGGKGAYATDATVNTGGGGGGAGYSATYGGMTGGDGGSGIVVIRYEEMAFGTPSNMTLVSESTTAQAAPTKGDLVLTYTNAAGTAVVGTNITAEYSADAGSTWTDFGIAAGDVQGTTGGHTIVTKNNVTLTSTSGTSMRYRIKTLVQSASLATRIHAVSLGWS